MKKVFIRTKNVKRFVALMDELQKLPPNIPKLALIYGEHGLGKTYSIMWWVDKQNPRTKLLKLLLVMLDLTPTKLAKVLHVSNSVTYCVQMLIWNFLFLLS
jgi:hypothetical protein